MGTNGDTLAIVALVEGLAPLWVSESVKVELRPAAGSSPFRAMVGYDGRLWRILVADELRGSDLMHTLFHELAHVALGHVSKDYTWSAVELAYDRALMAGTADRRDESQFWKRRASYDAERWKREAQRDRAADAWAAGALARWWPVLMRITGGA